MRDGDNGRIGREAGPPVAWEGAEPRKDREALRIGESRDPCVEGNGQAAAEPITQSTCYSAGLSSTAYVQGFLAHGTEEVGRNLGGDALTSIRPGGLLSAGGMTAVLASWMDLRKSREHYPPSRDSIVIPRSPCPGRLGLRRARRRSGRVEGSLHGEQWIDRD